MSNKEQLIEMIDNLSEAQIESLKSMLVCFIPSLSEDEYCTKLYEDYLSDSEEDKNDNISVNDFAFDLGIII